MLDVYISENSIGGFIKEHLEKIVTIPIQLKLNSEGALFPKKIERSL